MSFALNRKVAIQTLTPGFEGFLPGFFPFDGFFFLPDDDDDDGDDDVDNDDGDGDDGDKDDDDGHPLRQSVRAAHRPAPVTTASW